MSRMIPSSFLLIHCRNTALGTATNTGKIAPTSTTNIQFIRIKYQLDSNSTLPFSRVGMSSGSRMSNASNDTLASVKSELRLTIEQRRISGKGILFLIRLSAEFRAILFFAHVDVHVRFQTSVESSSALARSISSSHRWMTSTG